MAFHVWAVLLCLLASLFLSAEAEPQINYAAVRAHVSHACEERAHEMSAVLSVLQEVSKATVFGIDRVKAKCGTSS